MRKIDFLIALLCVIIGLLIGFNLNNKNDRYQITKGFSDLILLDKKTGVMWRNCWVDDKEQILNYWEEMRFIVDPENSDPVLPIGKGNFNPAKLKPIK